MLTPHTINNSGEMAYKKCFKCEKEKPIQAFRIEKIGSSFGRRNACDICEKERRRLYREKNRLKMRALDYAKYHSMSEDQKAEYVKKKSEQNIRRFKYNKEASEKRKAYGKSDRGLYTAYRADADRRGRNYVFELTFEQFQKLINSSCKYCGKENCRGIDRVNNEVGYVIDNCVSCCHRCNEMKNKYSISEWIMQMKTILKNVGEL